MLKELFLKYPNLGMPNQHDVEAYKKEKEEMISNLADSYAYDVYVDYLESINFDDPAEPDISSDEEYDRAYSMFSLQAKQEEYEYLLKYNSESIYEIGEEIPIIRHHTAIKYKDKVYIIADDKMNYLKGGEYDEL